MRAVLARGPSAQDLDGGTGSALGWLRFLTRDAADPCRNCDSSTVPLTLNAPDFIRFQARFAAGCPLTSERTTMSRQHHSAPLAIPALVAAAALAAALSSAAAQSFTGLGLLPGGSYSYGDGVSADGSTVVGTANAPSSGYLAFQWTPGGGMVNLGTLPLATFSGASCVSADGSVVAGDSRDTAVRWVGGVIQDLGALATGEDSGAFAVSADGSVVVGYSDSSAGHRAFRWTSAGGMASLGTLPGSASSNARGVSADGAAVAGYSYSLGSPAQAWIWTAGGGLVSLGRLPGATESVAWAISGDGLVVVGSSLVQFYNHAFRWTASGGMKGLGTLPGSDDSRARGTNTDGSVVVGESGGRAFLWTAASGMVDLNTYLPTLGISLSGWSLSEARAVSADGRTIVGRGNHNGTSEGWVAVLSGSSPCYADCDESGALDFFDFLCFQNLFAAADPEADCDESGGLDFFDFLCFQNAFALGCP